MRFMMLVKASEDSEAGALPSEGQLVEMGRYNDELVKAGVLLAADGLQASVKGARVVFSGGQTTVTDGPFTETKELIAGYWVIQVRSKDEALEWARRVPFQDGEIEIRQVFEAEDFGDALTPELREQEERQRAEMTAKR
ncbi:MAG: YciI family protein [Pseudonocardiaceae bacterium]